MVQFQEILTRLKKPLSFALQEGPHRVGRLKNLPAYVRRQVQLAGEIGLDRRRLSLLSRVNELFLGFDQAPEPERIRRVHQALDCLDEVQLEEKPPIEPGSSTSDWNAHVDSLPGVGPARGKRLSEAGIETVEDLLLRLPWRYEDRSAIRPIAQLRLNEDQTCLGRVQSVRLVVTPRKRLKMVELLLGDSSGSVVAKWFNQAYLAKQFKVGQEVLLSGKLKVNRYRGLAAELENPIYEILREEGDPLHAGRVVPIYHEGRFLSSRQVRVLIKTALERFADRLPDPVPEKTRERLALISIQEALWGVHFPASSVSTEVLNRSRSDAHRRLILQELLLLQLGFGIRRRAARQSRGAPVFAAKGDGRRRFLASLPFELTSAQKRVLRDIDGDLKSGRAMNRLLQGDVGCGKTVVAIAMILTAVDHGFQAALMAPTEILAEQHFLGLRRSLEPLGLECALLTGKRSGRDGTARRIASGEVPIAVGTHALLEGAVQFKNLGAAVIDEQHKFGVLQRAGLVSKGPRPHVLVMTATPIPRTLAMTLYGDLDVSVIDEQPPGRLPILTEVFEESEQDLVHGIVREEVKCGRQVYVVYPLVDESAKIDLKAAVDEFENLRWKVFPNLSVGLLHGQMKSREKEAVMADFQNGRLSILVATSVIEVGIDVPNASVMVIEHADRFGLSQLHQLRGRIGRGPYSSRCILMAAPRANETALRRLEALVKSSDGFRIAEEDLAIRGPGEFFGTRQAGVPALRVAHIVRDAAFLEMARDEAERILGRDADLSEIENFGLREAMARRWGERVRLGDVR